MGYDQFSQPPGTYNKVLTPPDKTSVSQRPILIPSKGKKGVFIEKKVTEGVGNYHGNHFIGYFYPKNGIFPPNPSKDQIIKANQLFYENFCLRFSYQNVASAIVSDYKIGAKKIIEFRLNAFLNDLDNLKFINRLIVDNWRKLKGIVHSDCVSIEMAEDKLSFYGSTLKMEWIEDNAFALFTDLAAFTKVAGLNTLEQAVEFMKNVVFVNQHHFLAGRRSWAIGYNEELNLWYVESVAYERSSLCEYNIIDKYAHLRDTILDLWTILIHNFSSYLTQKYIHSIDKKYNLITIYDYEFNAERRIAFKTAEEKFSTKLLNLPWYAEALQRHPGLTKGL